MVKNSLKLKQINSEAQALLPKKDKRKQSKLKILKSKKYIEKILDQKLVKEKKPHKKRQAGILGSLSSLEESLNQIKYSEDKTVKTKLSKREKQLIEYLLFRNHDVQRFQAVLENKNFISNPLEAIKQHLESQYN